MVSPDQAPSTATPIATATDSATPEAEVARRVAKPIFEKWLAKYENPELDSDTFDASLRAAYDASPTTYRTSWVPRLAELAADRGSRIAEHGHPRNADRIDEAMRYVHVARRTLRDRGRTR